MKIILVLIFCASITLLYGQSNYILIGQDKIALKSVNDWFIIQNQTDSILAVPVFINEFRYEDPNLRYDVSRLEKDSNIVINYSKYVKLTAAALDNLIKFIYNGQECVLKEVVIYSITDNGTQRQKIEFTETKIEYLNTSRAIFELLGRLNSGDKVIIENPVLLFNKKEIRIWSTLILHIN